MKIRIAVIVVVAGIVGISYGQQTPSSRIALVIGVQNYSSVPPLRHSISDANDMTILLKTKGFKVETLIDPKTKREIKDAITRYYNIMKSQSGAVGIIYYAGHGTQSEGENYLIPTSASLTVPGDLDDQCVKMNVFMSVLNSSNSNLNIFLLDACRTNTFPSFSRDFVKGLANVEAPKGSIVVFATQPGTVASDGTGRNGLFTSKLLKYINQPNLNIGDVLKKVKQDVNSESGGNQLPSVVDNSIGGDFYFSPEKELSTTALNEQSQSLSSNKTASTEEKRTDEFISPGVSMVRTAIVGQQMVIKYELTGIGYNYNVSVRSAYDNFANPLKLVYGSVGPHTLKGHNTIYWNFRKELPSGWNGQNDIRVIATPELEGASIKKENQFDYSNSIADATTVKVGSQEWLSKNLNVDHFINGDPIQKIKTPEEWQAAADNKQPAWCYSNNDSLSGTKYGKLYNWYAVHDPRGLAPKGMHLPSDGEWTLLVSYLGGEDIAGVALKSKVGWGINDSGNNSSGVFAIPGNCRSSNGTFLIGEFTYWWSYSEDNDYLAWYRFLTDESDKIYRGSNVKGMGMSVRCIKD